MTEERINWVLNEGGESPYDMMRRGKEIPKRILEEANRKRILSAQLPSFKSEPQPTGVRPIFRMDIPDMFLGGYK